MRVLALLFTLALLGPAARSEAQEPLPLMPPRERYVSLPSEDAGRATQIRSLVAKSHDRGERTPSYTRISGSRRSRYNHSGPILGMELGTVGRQNSTSSDALGLKLLYGGRASLIFPMGKRFYLKPSLGFFFRRDSVGKVAVNEHMAELGLTAQYAFATSGQMIWLVGLVNRVEGAFSKTSVSTVTAGAGSTPASESSGLALQYRVGPSLGFTYRINPSLGMLLDLESTFAISDPVKVYGGFVMGLLFRL